MYGLADSSMAPIPPPSAPLQCPNDSRERTIRRSSSTLTGLQLTRYCSDRSLVRPSLIRIALSIGATVPNAQQLPHDAWFLIGVQPLSVRQSQLAGGVTAPVSGDTGGRNRAVVCQSAGSCRLQIVVNGLSSPMCVPR